MTYHVHSMLAIKNDDSDLFEQWFLLQIQTFQPENFYEMTITYLETQNPKVWLDSHDGAKTLIRDSRSDKRLASSMIHINTREIIFIFIKECLWSSDNIKLKTNFK